MQLDRTLFMSSMNVSHELTSSNGMWFSILKLTLLSNMMMNAVLLSDLAFIEAYLPIASRKIQIREREKIVHEASASNVSSSRRDRCHSLLSDGIQ